MLAYSSSDSFIFGVKLNASCSNSNSCVIPVFNSIHMCLIHRLLFIGAKQDGENCKQRVNKSLRDLVAL